jgi:hypothetical protein
MRGKPVPQCAARWWHAPSRTIFACGDIPRLGYLRCAKHAPDGSRLTDDGVPVTAETRAQRMAARGAKRG